MEALPRKVEYRTILKILQYLEASEKILLTEDGSIVWVFADNPKLLELLKQSPVLTSEATPTLPNIARNLKIRNNRKIST